MSLLLPDYMKYNTQNYTGFYSYYDNVRYETLLQTQDLLGKVNPILNTVNPKTMEERISNLEAIVLSRSQSLNEQEDQIASLSKDVYELTRELRSCRANAISSHDSLMEIIHHITGERSGFAYGTNIPIHLQEVLAQLNDLTYSMSAMGQRLQEEINAVTGSLCAPKQGAPDEVF